MKTAEQFSRLGFVKSYLLPVLIIFLLPGFGLWFFKHVEAHYDETLRQSLLTQIRNSTTMSAEDRKTGLEFYGRVSISRLLASNKPEAKEMQENFKDLKFRFGTFRWMKRISLICILTGVTAFVGIGIGVWVSFRSQEAQYWSLAVGWHVLRWFALLQVVGQATLAVALSFWVTAFWIERYYAKLILIAVIAAVGAVGMIIQAIFRKLPTESSLDGRLLKKEDAVSLWTSIAAMAARLGISPPDQIFVGIDDNFFVTEHPVRVGEQTYSGRTLFASLSLLKVLTRGEADAVLAHELGHFCHQDTLYSKRISPLLGRYAFYLEALYQGGLSRPVFHFMHCFWNLYQLSLNKLSREREFRADRTGAELTSPSDMARALVKISAYCRYRAKVQSELFDQPEDLASMNVGERIEAGFPIFLRACVSGNELVESRTPHPFDSHPPLGNRLGELGLDPAVAIGSDLNLQPAGDSWFMTIESAPAIENEQWKAFEESFHKAHQEMLAYRFPPEGEGQIAHVMKFFPTLQFQSSKGLVATLDYEKLQLSGWESPIYFARIEGCKLQDGLGGKSLVIHCSADSEGKKLKRDLKPGDLRLEGRDFMEAFQNYYGRFLTAQKHAEETREAAAAAREGG